MACRDKVRAEDQALSDVICKRQMESVAGHVTQAGDPMGDIARQLRLVAEMDMRVDQSRDKAVPRASTVRHASRCCQFAGGANLNDALADDQYRPRIFTVLRVVVA
ncbi:MAG: hypothetical protein U5K38_05800 [Woeseiaceae bacterium]|nr:hypothetical protein [Woeseiaceae bacterium]